MTAEMIVGRLRRFLLMLAASICLGTVVELWFTEHWGEPLQLIPFVLCAIGFASVLGALLRPQRSTLLTLRVVMVVVGLGSLLGMSLHMLNNYEFALEIRPNATAIEAVMDALHGANPLLAPGVLALAATLAIAATYYHPALNKAAPPAERMPVYPARR